MQNADWTDYQSFLAIARAGKLSRAAAVVGVDPTTMSRRLRRLESRLKETLFESARDGQSLTEAGEALLVAVEAMAQAAASISEHGGSESEPSGTVRISVSEGFGGWFVSRHVRDFAAAYPQLSVDLVASSGFLSPSKREADIAVMLSRPKAGPVMARKLSDYALRLYASPAYLAEAGAPADIAALARGHRLIGYIPDLLYSPELRYLAELHPELTASVRSSSINAQYRLVVEGAGIGVLPCFIANADPLLVPLFPDRQIRRSFWLVTHQDTQNLVRVRTCKEWLLRIVQQDRKLLLP